MAGDGNRVKSVMGGVTTYYVGNHFEWTGDTTSMVKYYYADGQRVAMRQGSSTVYYLLGDHLGSTSLTASSSGSKVAELRYHPWGGTRFTSGTTPTSYQFTGQRNDYYIKLYHMGARMYDPELGRFISPDSIIPNPADPQSLNRYSYVYNSPLKYTDPSGHEPISIIIAIGIVLFKAVDYGWTAYDAWQSSLTFSNPNATDAEKAAAAANLAMTAAFEAAEPDDLLPVGLPLDDLARHGVLKYGDEAIQYGDEVIAGGSETYRAVSNNWPFNWKPTKGDIAGNPAGLSCSVGCEGMSYQEIFEMSVGRSAEPGDHLYAVNTEVLQNSKFGLTLDPLLPSNPYHAVTGGSQVLNWTKPIAREFKDMWQSVWSFIE